MKVMQKTTWTKHSFTSSLWPRSRALTRKNSLFVITLTLGMELNRNLAHGKTLPSLTFLSIISFPMGHVICYVANFFKITNIWRIGDGFKRKHQIKTLFRCRLNIFRPSRLWRQRLSLSPKNLTFDYLRNLRLGDNHFKRRRIIRLTSTRKA